MTKIVKILSIRHAWAYLIVHEDKDVENRTWSASYRGPLLIHAGKKIAEGSPRLSADKLGLLRFGGIVGIANVVDCVTQHSSRWFEGPFAFVLERRRPIPFVPWRGEQGLRNAPQKLLERIDDDELRKYLAS